MNKKQINNKRLTTEEFINRANKLHNYKYDYSLVVYKNAWTKVDVICSVHGTYKQRAYSHLGGQGCITCSGKKKNTVEDFSKKGKKVHGDKYDYSLVDYKNNKTKVKIICPIHGVFEQTLNNHLKYGCSDCGGTKKLNTDNFISKSNEVHNNKFDYSLVNYKNNNTKVEIICPKHGSFKQRAGDHMRGVGCPGCNSSKGEIKVKNFLNKNNIEYMPQYKFKDCKDKKTLPFDFYLPKLNVCIEYDGSQHFNPYGWDEKGVRLYETQKHDNIKNEYCSNNNIKLVRIPYYEKNNIEKLLSKVLGFY
jgi:very-short-patch-repair endonuclease/ribosomal protein L36